MTRDQKIVAAGAASGIITMALAVWLLHLAIPAPDTANVGDRIGYALKWNVLAAFPYFAMLAAVGNSRFLSEAIDPTLGKESKRMIVDGRVADNTGQQLLVFAIGSCALAAVPTSNLSLVAAAAITFALMRLAFWIGYRIDPLYRAFGFAGTAYLNLGLLVAAAWLSLS
jgi:hypothetical protein